MNEMRMVNITLQSHGNPDQDLQRPAGTKIRDIVANAQGLSVHLMRGGDIIDDPEMDTELLNGDRLMTVHSKAVGGV